MEPEHSNALSRGGAARTLSQGGGERLQTAMPKTNRGSESSRRSRRSRRVDATVGRGAYYCSYTQKVAAIFRSDVSAVGRQWRRPRFVMPNPRFQVLATGGRQRGSDRGLERTRSCSGSDKIWQSRVDINIKREKTRRKRRDVAGKRHHRTGMLVKSLKNRRPGSKISTSSTTKLVSANM